jgi:uncharacterized membrane protein YcjF (UPF0283 family)
MYASEAKNEGVQVSPGQQAKPDDDCRRAQRDYRLALDSLARARRDLGETAAIMAATLTTVTAIQAVISIAVDRLALPIDYLQWGFYVYIAVIVLIFLVGIIRSLFAFRRRGRAEREMDRAKAEIFIQCSQDLWPEPEG